MLLPQQYQVTQAVRIDSPQATVTPLLIDFNNWHAWQPWARVDDSIKFTIAEPSKGVGAHQFWQSRWGHGEMTITQLTQDEMHFNLLFNQEHIAQGLITFKVKNNIVVVQCSLNGEVNTPIVGGYLALLNQYILNNTLKLALNNLKTHVQLEHD
ncbi:SRPBCC family protein [Pseudoalteromonas mariniglutinosa]|uniref:SRPBCC family protein n=1 Tax=Pseudoalteromonas mariniglutinosa TaxID=206042 RepID=UPI00384ED52C